MKSIRLTLIVYFLALLAVALGSVSALVYMTTAGIVQARQDATQKMLRVQHDRRGEDERARFDIALLQQARNLASHAQFQLQGSRARFQALMPLGLLAAGHAPIAYVQVPIWSASGIRSPLYYRLQRLAGGEIQFNEDDLTADDGPTQFIQISMEWGNTWRSRSMGEHAFPFDPDQFASIPMFDWKFDNVELKPGEKIRRVTLKVPLAKFRFIGSRWSTAAPPSPSFVGPPAPPPPRPPSDEPRPERSEPWVAENIAPGLLVQCAAGTTERDDVIATYQTELDQEIAALQDESRATLATLRKGLWGIGLVTFAGTVVGGFGLVWLGLLPLRRLSEAVSQVSERDFRLPLSGTRLPAELRPIAERLTDTLDQLRRAFAREKQAAADISHELRTPLAVLLTTTELALRKPRAADEYRQLLSDCRSIGQQMNVLVERLLTLARLDAGVDRLRPQSVDAAALATQCAGLVRPLAEARGLRLTVQASEAACLTADPDKLREVMTNLLHNAIEYNRPEGSVDLKVGRQNGSLLVEVADTGIGIAPELRRSIFERFYRADPSRQAEGMHAGLGLSIVKGYVDLMGGDIAVESNPGGGSIFRVRLPAAEKPLAV